MRASITQKMSTGPTAVCYVRLPPSYSISWQNTQYKGILYGALRFHRGEKVWYTLYVTWAYLGNIYRTYWVGNSILLKNVVDES